MWREPAPVRGRGRGLLVDGADTLAGEPRATSAQPDDGDGIGAAGAGGAADHGVRRAYQLGCRCEPCTTANTQYSAEYRKAHRAGRPPLGAHVAGTEAARVIAELVADGYRKAQIATWLGHRRPVLHWYRGAGVTVRTLLRLRILRRRIDEGRLIV